MRCMRPLRKHPDALPQGSLASSHRSGCPQQIRSAPAAQAQQRAPIVRALTLAQPANGRFITGQLRVSLGERRRPPDEGIIPVQSQAQPTQQRPDMVALPPVSQLVLQHVPERRSLQRSLQSKIHRGP